MKFSASPGIGWGAKASSALHPTKDASYVVRLVSGGYTAHIVSHATGGHKQLGGIYPTRRAAVAAAAKHSL